MPDDQMCQCPKCGRLHNHLRAGTPPVAIAGPSLLRPAERLQPSGIYEGLPGRIEHGGTPPDAGRRESALSAANESLCNAYHEMRAALIEIASVGDGFGARNRQSGTNGDGHARCRAIADKALGIGFADLPSVHSDADEFWGNFRRESADAESQDETF